MAEKKNRFNLGDERAFSAVMKKAEDLNAPASVQTSDISRPADIRLLPLEQLISAHFNKLFVVEDIDSLATSIREEGLLHNIVVRPLPDGNYEIISGHRRAAACRKLVDEGFDQFRKISCSIKYMDDKEAEIALIHANIETRELSVIQRVNAAARLAELFGNDPSITGRTREAVAEEMGVSPRTAQNLLTIHRKMIPELQSLIDARGISLRDATSIAGLSEEAQHDILDALRKDEDLSESKAKEEVNTIIEKYEQDKREFDNAVKKRMKEYNEKIRSLENELADTKAKTEADIRRESILRELDLRLQSSFELCKSINELLDESNLDLNELDPATQITMKNIAAAYQKLFATLHT